ncbi:MAG: pyridoxamine 5'-phosphate oxidase family protein [Pseudonocardiales bacterium]|nr:MAG: pyridoxamine 5'-phosphate oxidase family protein [Pseudonocardiales bacterium]
MTSPQPTQIRRRPERAHSERGALDAVLDSGEHVATLSTVFEGRPWVVPMLYGRDGDRILLHGSTGAGALRHVVDAGAPAALSVTHLDGWVYAHTLFDSSANYRSAVIHGQLVRLDAEESMEALIRLSERVFPGRGAEVPAHTRRQVAATQALALPIVEGQWTVKIRQGQPAASEPDDDVAAELWTGVVPVRTVYGEPEPADRVASGIAVSPSIRAYVEDRR